HLRRAGGVPPRAGRTERGGCGRGRGGSGTGPERDHGGGGREDRPRRGSAVRGRRVGRARSVRIVVSHGTGEGPTPLAAFDKALLAAGVENYNLIRLSSVIPPGAGIERRRFVSPRDEDGRRLYGLMAVQRAT